MHKITDPLQSLYSVLKLWSCCAEERIWPILNAEHILYTFQIPIYDCQSFWRPYWIKAGISYLHMDFLPVPIRFQRLNCGTPCHMILCWHLV